MRWEKGLIGLLISEYFCKVARRERKRNQKLPVYFVLWAIYEGFADRASSKTWRGSLTILFILGHVIGAANSIPPRMGRDESAWHGVRLYISPTLCITLAFSDSARRGGVFESSVPV